MFYHPGVQHFPTAAYLKVFYSTQFANNYNSLKLIKEGHVVCFLSFCEIYNIITYIIVDTV